MLGTQPPVSIREPSCLYQQSFFVAQDALALDFGHGDGVLGVVVESYQYHRTLGNEPILPAGEVALLIYDQVFQGHTFRAQLHCTDVEKRIVLQIQRQEVVDFRPRLNHARAVPVPPNGLRKVVESPLLEVRQVHGIVYVAHFVEVGPAHMNFFPKLKVFDKVKHRWMVNDGYFDADGLSRQLPAIR